MNQVALERNGRHALSRMRLLVLLVLSAAALLATAPEASAQFDPESEGQDFCSGTSWTARPEKGGTSGSFQAKKPVSYIAVTPSGSGIVSARMHATNAEECLRQESPTSFRVETVCEYHCYHNHMAPTGWWVEMMATAAPGVSFLGWSGATCVARRTVARSSCVIKMGNGNDSAPTDQSVTAHFGTPADTQAPAPQPSVTASPGSYAVSLSWSQSNDDWFAGYEVYRDGVLEARLMGSAATSHRVENLLCRRSHTFEVVAYDWSRNEARSGPVAVTTGACQGEGQGGPKPDTVIHVKPPKTTRSRQAFFHYGRRGAIPVTKYQCKLDRGRWVACSGQAGKRYRNLRVGLHTFRVRAGNANGFDRTPATYTWRVRR